MNYYAIIVALIGVFILVGAYFNWDWFMDNHRGRFYGRLLGSRQRVRIFYAILGVAFVIGGILVGMGVITLN